MPAPLSPLQSVVDEAVSSWPDVRAKQVFGHRGFVRNGKMFAFIADTGVAFKMMPPADAETLYAAGAATPFVYNGSMEMRAWPVLPLASDADVTDALTAVRQAYEDLD